MRNLDGEVPRRLWVVIVDVGYGWPACYRREHRVKVFKDRSGVARELDRIGRFPDHDHLHGVFELTVGEVTPCDPAGFVTQEDDEHGGLDETVES